MSFCILKASTYSARPDPTGWLVSWIPNCLVQVVVPSPWDFVVPGPWA